MPRGEPAGDRGARGELLGEHRRPAHQQRAERGDEPAEQVHVAVRDGDVQRRAQTEGIGVGERERAHQDPDDHQGEQHRLGPGPRAVGGGGVLVFGAGTAYRARVGRALGPHREHGRHQPGQHARHRPAAERGRHHDRGEHGPVPVEPARARGHRVADHGAQVDALGHRRQPVLAHQQVPDQGAAVGLVQVRGRAQVSCGVLIRRRLCPSGPRHAPDLCHHTGRNSHPVPASAKIPPRRERREPDFTTVGAGRTGPPSTSAGVPPSFGQGFARPSPGAIVHPRTSRGDSPRGFGVCRFRSYLGARGNIAAP